MSTNRFWTFDIRISTVCCLVLAAWRRSGYRLITARTSSNCESNLVASSRLELMP